MHVKIKQAEKLYEAGYHENVPTPAPGMVYYYDEEEWTVGGVRGKELFIPNVVLKDGIYLPDEKELMSFLSRRNCSVTYSYNDLWLSVTVYPENGKKITIRAISLCDALCEAVLRILQNDYK